MNALKTEFGANDYWLQQIWRNDRLALYTVALSKQHEPHGLEFIAIQQKEAVTWPDGRTTPDREGYPSNEQFGSKGYSWPIRIKSFLLDLLKTIPGPELRPIRGLVHSYLKKHPYSPGKAK